MPVLVPLAGATPAPTPDADRYAVRELVEEVLEDLAGFTMDMGQVTSLLAPITATSLSFQVDEADQLHAGLAEIGDELVYVKTAVNGTCTVQPFGRGYRASVAKSWPAGTEVTFGPRFPRHVVLNAINDTLEAVWDQLFAIGETDFSFVPTQGTFALPAEAEGVTRVEFDEVGPQKTWTRIDGYTFSDGAATVDFPTGKSITLPYALTPGRTVRVRYMKKPSTVTSDDTFTDSGLALSAWRCIKHGALADLVTKIPLGSLALNTAESNEWARVRPMDPLKISQHHYALHVQYRDEERKRLLAAEPLTVHYTR